MLTTSRAQEDMLRSYSLHASAYLTKPAGYDRFVEVIREIDGRDGWLPAPRPIPRR
jgi:DNA-binding NarL/FixJ family response regulator